MQPFTRVTGVAIPLLLAHVDTDLIIPIQRLLGGARDALGPFAFERLRYRADGSENPDFVPSQAPWRGSPILLAGENFGCGSSREGAVWALMGIGVRAVIAPSFGDIFVANCFQNGVLPVCLPALAVQRIAEETRAAPGHARTTVDLERAVVVTPGGAEIAFGVDARRREALLHGLDDIALTLRESHAIAAFRARDAARRPWATDSLG